MCVCMCVHVCEYVCMCVCACVCLCMHVCMWGGVCMCVCLQVWLGEGKKCGKGQATGIKFVEAVSGIPQAKLVCAVIHTLHRGMVQKPYIIQMSDHSTHWAEHSTQLGGNTDNFVAKSCWQWWGRAIQLAFKTHPKRQSEWGSLTSTF